MSLRHLYRTMGFLGEPLAPPAKDASPDDLRTRKDWIEEEPFARRRDLFGDVELVFFDTSWIDFDGGRGQSAGPRLDFLALRPMAPSRVRQAPTRPRRCQYATGRPALDKNSNSVHPGLACGAGPAP